MVKASFCRDNIWMVVDPSSLSAKDVLGTYDEYWLQELFSATEQYVNTTSHGRGLALSQAPPSFRCFQYGKAMESWAGN